MPTIQMIFPRNQPPFFAGQVMRGTVRMSLSKQTTVRKLFIEIIEETQQKWEKYVKHYDQETYLNERLYFIGKRNEKSSGKIEFGPGEYDYSFQFNLPPNLPTTIEAKPSHIRCELNVFFSTSLVSSDWNSWQIPIIRPIDLNSLPALREPVIAETSKKVSFYCFWVDGIKSIPVHPLELIARIPHGGYAPGQTIHIEIRKKYQSSENISKFKVELVRKIKHMRGPEPFYGQNETIVTKQISGGQLSQPIYTSIEVPLFEPPTDTTCKLVKCHYQIRITGIVSMFHKNPVIKIPVMIGTLPFHNNSGDDNILLPYCTS